MSRRVGLVGVGGRVVGCLFVTGAVPVRSSFVVTGRGLTKPNQSRDTLDF